MCGRSWYTNFSSAAKKFNANGSAYKAACTCEIWKRKIRGVSLPFVPHSSTPSVSQVLCRRSQIGGKVRCVFFFLAVTCSFLSKVIRQTYGIAFGMFVLHSWPLRFLFFTLGRTVGPHTKVGVGISTFSGTRAPTTTQQMVG